MANERIPIGEGTGEWIAKAVELIRFGEASVGAIHQGPNIKLSALPGLHCPWCKRLVPVTIFAADQADTGDIGGGVFPWTDCSHFNLVRALWNVALEREGHQPIDWTISEEQ